MKTAVTAIIAVLAAAALTVAIAVARTSTANAEHVAQKFAVYEIRIAHLERMNAELIKIASRTIDQQVREQTARFQLQAELDRATGR